MSERVVAFGEIVLRLKSPGFERFLQSPVLEATFGGGEANVAISLAHLGVDVGYVTVLPDNPIADACVDAIGREGVDTCFIVRGGERMGAYDLEAGGNQRPSRVIYDRANSAIATAEPGSLNWDGIFDGAWWLHITGINHAVLMSCVPVPGDSWQSYIGTAGWTRDQARKDSLRRLYDEGEADAEIAVAAAETLGRRVVQMALVLKAGAVACHDMVAENGAYQAFLGRLGSGDEMGC